MSALWLRHASVPLSPWSAIHYPLYSSSSGPRMILSRGVFPVSVLCEFSAAIVVMISMIRRNEFLIWIKQSRYKFGFVILYLIFSPTASSTRWLRLFSITKQSLARWNRQSLEGCYFKPSTLSHKTMKQLRKSQSRIGCNATLCIRGTKVDYDD